MIFSSQLGGSFVLARPLNCLITAASVVVGAVTSGLPVWQPEVALAALSAGLIAGAGNCYNDLLDLEIDRINRPRRPLPSERVDPPTALAMAVSLGIVGLGFAWSLGLATGLIATAVVALLFTYSAVLKTRPLWGNAVVSGLAAAAFPFGAAASGAWGRSWIPAGFAFLFHLGREIAKDIEDVEGDRAREIRTLATVHGVRAAAMVSAGVFLLLAAATTIPWVLGVYGTAYLTTVAVLDLSAITLILRLVARPDTGGRQVLSQSLTGVMGIGLLAILLGEMNR